MSRYISILRGINVSGKNLIKMAELRSSFEKIGFKNISTYLQSGNILFSDKKIARETIEKEISKQIKKDFGLDIPVIVFTVQEVKKIITANPFLKDEAKNPDYFHVTFLATKPLNFDVKEIEKKKMDGEEIIYNKNVFYLYCPNGYGRTKLNNTFLEKKSGVIATTRNWKTTNEILKKAMEKESE